MNNKISLLQIIRTALLASIALAFSMSASAAYYKLPPSGSDVVGEYKTITAGAGQTLTKLGRRYDIGYYEMLEANPDINPNKKLSPWTKVVIPSKFILPEGPRKGIVINIAEMRLYYYPPGTNEVMTVPVGIGKAGSETPTGVTKIIDKMIKPTWRPTKDTRAEAASEGIILPKKIPPGPDNPLGDYAMRMGWYSYLIHGTNRPDGVGKRVSAGCIRMFPEDIKELFKHVRVGTRVFVVDDPIKVGWNGNQLYLESHKRVIAGEIKSHANYKPIVSEIVKVAKRRNYRIDWQAAQQASKSATGVPHSIGGTW